MSLWDTLRSWVSQQTDHYIYEPILDDRADDVQPPTPLEPDRSYFRVWLSEMQLSHSRSWFTDWYPAVHSAVRLRFGDRDEVTLTHVARAPEEALARGVLLNFPVTELLPFRGGVVELEGGLLGLRGDNHLQTVIGVLGDFAGLVAAPVGQALTVAEKVATGLDKIVGATDGRVELGLHQAFTSEGGGGRVLTPRYLAVVGAREQDVDRNALRVRSGRLRIQRDGGDPAPVEDVDYMLYRIEGRLERDDWRLSNIEEPMERAVEAILEGEEEKAESFRRAALLAALTSSDLAVHDRRRVVGAIKAELDEIADLGLGAAPAEPRDLQTLMETRAMDTDEALLLGPMSLEEALAG